MTSKVCATRRNWLELAVMCSRRTFARSRGFSPANTDRRTLFDLNKGGAFSEHSYENKENTRFDCMPCDAIDGANIVICEGNGVLLSMRASDGAQVFSLDVKGYVNNVIVPVLFPFVVQSIEQSGLFYDGQNIWVGVSLNGLPFVILKIRASDASVLSYIYLLPLGIHQGTVPGGIVFDGKYI